MKRTFVKISALAVTFGVVLASCNNESENAKLQEADDLAVQGLVDAKWASLDSALAAEWDAKASAEAAVVAAANAAAKKSTAKPAAKKPAPVAKKEEPKPVSAKDNKFGGSGQATKEQTQQKADKFEGGGKITPTTEQVEKKKDKFK